MQVHNDRLISKKIDVVEPLVEDSNSKEGSIEKAENEMERSKSEESYTTPGMSGSKSSADAIEVSKVSNQNSKD